MKNRLRLASAALSVFLLLGCWQRFAGNQEYFTYLASLIESYEAKYGTNPDSIDDMLDKLKIRIPNRGDIHGNPLFYLRVNHSAYMLRSFGPNQTDDRGRRDDFSMYFIQGSEVDTELFIRYLKTYDRGLLWEVYSPLFPDEPANEPTGQP